MWLLRTYTLKKNPLKNLGAMLKLNPYAKTARRAELLAQVPLLAQVHAPHTCHALQPALSSPSCPWVHGRNHACNRVFSPFIAAVLQCVDGTWKGSCMHP